MVLLAAASAALTGCKGCHDQKPYTPYHLGDAPSASASAAAAANPPAADAGAFEAVIGKAPEGDGSTWKLAAGAVPAPVGRAFGAGVEVDIDSDGKPDLLAWAKGPDGLRGEVVFAPGAAPDKARTVFALPGELAPPGCSAKTTLTRVGPRSATLDFKPFCPAVSRDRAVRYVAVVRWPDPADGKPAAPELGLELRIAAATDGEPLDASVTTTDKDGDGRPDLLVTLSTGKVSPASVGLVFFDRPAGLSRDPAEPEAALKAQMTALFADARKPKTAAKAGPQALALRRLYAAVCEESGHALLTTSAGPVRCGDLKVEADTALVDLEAAVNGGEAIAAAAALARVDALGSAGPRKKDVERLANKVLPTITPRGTKALAAAPAPTPPAGYGPLAFLTNGDLLVRTPDASVVRAETTALAETLDPPRAWPAQPSSGGAEPIARLVRVEQRCQDATLIAHVEIKAESGAKDSELALPIPISPRCAPVASLPTFPLGAAGPSVLVAVGADVARLQLGPTPSAHVPETFASDALVDEQIGASRSPDGLSLALPMARGVLVATADAGSRKAKGGFWSHPDLAKATFCVPANGARRVACVVGARVVVADR